MAITESDRLDPDARQRIERVIKEFLSKDWYEGIFETRIQKLIFYSEIYCVVHYRKRLTEASYKPFMYGAYSDDIRKILSTMDGVDRTREIRHGERTVEYSLTEFDREEFDAVQKITDQIHEATINLSTSDLARFSKDSWLFEHTKYNHKMRFDEFAEALDENPTIEEDLCKQIPDQVRLSEVELNDLIDIYY